MIRILILFFISFLCFAEIVSYPESWKADKTVRTLYSTPLGTLYEFPGTENNAYLTPDFSLQNHKKECGCVSCKTHAQTMSGGVLELQLPKQGKKQKRYLAIDFKIRAFPAISKKESSDFQILFVDSEKRISGARQLTLHGMLNIDRAVGRPSYTTTVETTFSAAKFFGITKPPFETKPFRMVYDRKELEWTLRTDLETLPFFKMQKRKQKFNPTHFGITVQSETVAPHRTAFLEISNPVIHMFDSKEELEALSPLKFIPYEYNLYPFPAKKNKNEKNPDLQYASALKLLYGAEGEGNVDEALELLEKTAKKHHVLALYQLGLCHFRGYGTEVDLKKARAYLNEAMKYNYASAGVLNWFITFETMGRPWFSAKEMNVLRDKIFYDQLHDAAFSTLFQGGFIFSRQLSPKLLFCPGISECEKKSHPNMKYIDYVIKSGYIPAYFAKAMNARTESERLSLLELAVAKGDEDAYPELLYSRRKSGGVLSARDFSPAKQLRYRDDPLFQILNFAVENPDFPGLDIFFKRAPNDLTRMSGWFGLNSAESQFLSSMSELYLLRNVRYITSDSFSYQERLDSAFRNLEKAANGKYPAAQYQLGRFLYYNDFPESAKLRYYKRNSRYAEQWLSLAHQSGFPGAGILLAKLKLDKKTVNEDEILNMLEFSCKLENPEALYLTALLFMRTGQPEKAAHYSLLAAEKGEVRGLQNLALLRKKNDPERLRCWHRFISADREARSLNRLDPFWLLPYAEYGKWERMEWKLTQ